MATCPLVTSCFGINIPLDPIIRPCWQALLIWEAKVTSNKSESENVQFKDSSAWISSSLTANSLANFANCSLVKLLKGMKASASLYLVSPES